MSNLLPPEGGVLPNDTLPIVNDDDVLAVLPAYMRNADPAPVRDALVAALRVMATTYQEAVTYAAMQRDVLYASGDELESLLPVRRRDGESMEDYRTRGLGLQAVVSPEAICAAVDSLIAPYKCSYIEPGLDQWFLPGVIDDGTDHTGDTVWCSYLDVAPTYQDRFYPDDSVANSAFVKPHVNPGPAALFDNVDGREFVLYIPDLSNLNSNIRLIYSGQKLNPADSTVPELGGAIHLETGKGESLGGTGLFMMGATATDANRTYLYSNTTSEDARYAAIVDVVERLRGAGFAWSLMVQPS